mmetsp:Transcript_4295/g.6444  ORF Transcript_4295/g.6444 Transcript_4295/m.6444 type:complete len:87 (-) Transcript_4295:110-370(-)
MINFLSALLVSFMCLINCFTGGSQVKRKPDDGRVVVTAAFVAAADFLDGNCWRCLDLDLNFSFLDLDDDDSGIVHNLHTLTLSFDG